MNKSILSSQSERYPDSLNFPYLIETLENVQKIFCGWDRSFALTYSKILYGWGNNVEQQLGLQSNTNTVKTPQIIEAFSDKCIENLSLGLNHNFAWSSETGEVYAWGAGSFGKLGFGNAENINEPTIMDCFNEASKVGMKITHIACGDNHTLAILNTMDEEKKDEAKKLFVWGCSKNWQLGLDNDFGEDILIPHQIDPDPWNGTISQVFANNNYSAALNSKGEVFTWGSGEFGRLGFKTETKQQKIPKKLTVFSEYEITQVSLGSYHAMALTENGEVFSWGRGVSGQLGHNKMTNEEIPKMINFFSGIKITNISCGENHSLALTYKGDIYGWGSNQYGQMGVSVVNRSSQPIKISIPDENDIGLDICCGKKHSLILTIQGLVYSFGSNEYGQLGVSLHKKSRSRNYSKQLNSPSDFSLKISPRINETNNSSFLKSIVKESNQINIEKTATFLGSDIKSPISLINNNNDIPLNLENSQSNSGQDVMIRKLMLENKILKSRIQELEFKEDLNKYQQKEQNIFIIANNYIKSFDEQIVFDPRDSFDIEAVNRNSKIDKILSEFSKELDEEKEGSPNTSFFCKNLIEKYSKIIKKSNYFIDKKN